MDRESSNKKVEGLRKVEKKQEDHRNLQERL